MNGGSLASFLLTGLFSLLLRYKKNLIGVRTLSEYIVVHSDTISNEPFHTFYAGVDTNMFIMITIIKLNMTDIGIFFSEVKKYFMFLTYNAKEQCSAIRILRPFS